MAEMKTLTLNGVRYDIEDAEAVQFTKQTLTEEQKAQARENIGAMSTVTGELGQVLSFDSDGNPAPMALLENIAETETNVNNLLDMSVGFTSGYGVPTTNDINVETLEMPLDNPSSANQLYSKFIILKPNTTYAFSNWLGNLKLYTDVGHRSAQPHSSNMTAGENCLLYTTPDSSTEYYYAAIAIHSSSPTKYTDMVICEGETLKIETPAVLKGTYLHNDIKVKAEQVEGLEKVIPDGEGANISLEPLTINGVTYDGTEPIEVTIAPGSGGTIDVKGTLGQVVGFDGNGNLAPMPLFEEITETETIVGNLFDASVGYTEGYNSPTGSINLETLEVPLDNPVVNGDPTAYKLHNALIHLEPNTTYAFSKFTGNATLFDGRTGTKHSFLTPGGSNLTQGDNCYLYTTGTAPAGYYLAINIHRASTTAYENMIIVKGDTLPAKTTVLVGIRLNENIKVKAEQVEGLEEMIPESSGGNDATSASSDFDTLYTVARKIQNYQSPTTLTCSLMSDTHYEGDKHNAEKCLVTARTMGLMEAYMKQDFIGNLGDMIPGNVEVETSRKYMAQLAQATNQNAKCPVFYARGNHDDNGWYSGGGMGGTYKTTEIMNDNEWYQAIFGVSSRNLVIDENRPNGGYGYFDHEASKIRVFILNTEDLPYIVEDDGTYRYSSYNGHALSNEQINFVANALYFADKENPREWAALFMSHVPLDTTNDDGYRFGIKDALIRGHEYFMAVIGAYRKGSAFAASGSGYNASLGDISADFNISVDVDYTEKGGGDVIAFVSGHTHTDNFSSLVGIEGSLSRGYAYIGLMGSTSFANFIFDRANNRICAVKYGTSSPDLTEGAAVEAPDTGSVESGEWIVNIDQFRPNGTNLYNGLSETHSGAGGIASATKIDKSTLEVDAIANQSGYLISKAIAVKPFTRYAIPSNWNGHILAFGAAGGKSSYITPTAANGYKYFQTGIRQYYVVFDHHTGSYTDYANFWIKEMGEGVEYA